MRKEATQWILEHLTDSELSLISKETYHWLTWGAIVELSERNFRKRYDINQKRF